MSKQSLPLPRTWTAILVLVLGAVLFVLAVKAVKDAWQLHRLRCAYKKRKSGLSTCSGKDGCNDNPDMLPVMDPSWALQELVGQILALEDHLNVPGKRCEDCINKHFIFARTLTDETVSLQTKDKYSHVLLPLSNNLRDCQKNLFTGRRTARETAKDLRAARKPLMPYLKDFWGDEYVGIVTDKDGEVVKYNRTATCKDCKE